MCVCVGNISLHSNDHVAFFSMCALLSAVDCEITTEALFCLFSVLLSNKKINKTSILLRAVNWVNGNT